MQTIHTQVVTSRKDHNCNGCAVYLDGYNWNDFSFSQKKELVRVVRDKFKIKKGQKYLRSAVTDGSEIWTFKVRIDVDDFLMKHGIYEEVNENL